MKKALSFLLLFVMLVSLSSCQRQHNFGMSNTLNSNDITLYYQDDEQSAQILLDALTQKGDHACEKLNIEPQNNVVIYAYDTQDELLKACGQEPVKTGQNQKFFSYQKQNAILTVAPENIKKYFEFRVFIQDVAMRITYECYVPKLNKKMPDFLRLGLSIYVNASSSQIVKEALNNKNIPDFDQLQKKIPEDGNFMGAYGYTYIDYLETNYGWDKLIELVKSMDYKKALGKSAQNVYDEWINFLKTDDEYSPNFEKEVTQAANKTSAPVRKIDDDAIAWNALEDGLFTVNYQAGEEKRAQLVMDTLNSCKDNVWGNLDIDDPAKLRVQVFRSGEDYAKVYGANQGSAPAITCPDRIILMSPSIAWGLTDNLKSAVVHEMTHYYHSRKEDNISMLLSEGMAAYSENSDRYINAVKYREYQIPSFEDMYFSKPTRQLAAYSYSYIDFLVISYAWDKTLQLSYTCNYENVLGKSEKQIYNEWVSFLNTNEKYKGSYSR